MTSGPPELESDQFPITEHALTLNVLIYLLEACERNDARNPLAGLYPGERDALRRMSVREIGRLTDQGQPMLRVIVDAPQVRLCLKRAQMREDTEATKRWFVQRGTPQLLMQELYGTPVREFREMRNELGLTHCTRGRPKVLKAAQAHKVQVYWAQMSTQLSPIERYKRLGEAFPEYSIASLYSALHECKH